MKNLVAKFFLSLVLVSGLVTFASAKTVSAASKSETIVKNFTVSAHSYRSHSLYLRAGETAYVKATGDGYTNLDMFVRDSKGYLIVSDQRNSTDGYVYFTATRSGYFQIQVVNRGKTYNNYQLKANIY